MATSSAATSIKQVFRRAAAGGARRFSTKGKATASEYSFPVVPALAIALSAPIVGFKTGAFSLDQLPDSITAALPSWVTKYLLTALPPSEATAPLTPVIVPAQPPAQPAMLPAILSPGEVAAYLDANKAQIVALLWRDLSKVRANESWLKCFTQPLTSRALWRERRAIEQQLALRDAH